MKISHYSWAVILSSPFLFTSMNYAKEISLSEASEIVSALPEQEKVCYPVSAIKLEFVGSVPNEQKLREKLENTSFRLVFTPVGVLAPSPKAESTKLTLKELSKNKAINSLYANAIQAIATALVETLSKEGYAGIAVQVDPMQITRDGKDVRKPGDYTLTLKVVFGCIGEIQAVEAKSNDDYKINSSRYNYILANCPVKVGDPIYKNKLDNYAYRLSRSPHRRVDVEVHSLNRANQIGVDFVVREARPWRVYGNVSNTGTTQIGKWQETIGYSNTNTTGIDDYIRLDGTSDSWNSFFNVSGLYEVPFFEGSKGKARLTGNHTHYGASEFGIRTANSFTGFMTTINGEAIYNAYQYRDFFLDIYGGLNFMSIKNKLGGNQPQTGYQVFASPKIGINIERFTSNTRFFMQLEAQGSGEGFLASNRQNIDYLGRVNTSKSWAFLTFRGATSFYLDPQKLVHELNFLAQGQYAFNYRLIPQLEAVLGGMYTVRGYPNSFVAGDQMAMLRSEYIMHVPQFLKPRPNQTGKLFGQPFKRAPAFPGDRADWDMALKLFVDAGRTVYNQRQSLIELNATLVSAGFGAEFRVKNYLTVKGETGVVLRDVFPETVGTSRFYLSTTLAY